MKKMEIDDSVGSLKAELEAIKRLLILGLIKSGSSQHEVAKALNVNQSTISRLFPKKKGGTTNVEQ